MIQDLKEYLEESYPVMKGRFFPVFTTDIKNPSIVYSVTAITGGHLKQSQLELKVIWKDYDECRQIVEDISEILDMEEDEKFISYGKTVFHSELAGGGCIFNDAVQMFEDTQIFIVKWRSKR